jgi:hypothetical protein
MDTVIIVEHLPSIDIIDLARKGAFDDGVTMHFPFLGLTTTRYLAHYVHYRSPADRPAQRISIQWTRCRFGGTRPWFTCLCGRRVRKLYYGNGFLGCRPCGEMIYSSQRWGPKRRFYMQAKRIRCRMGDYDGRPGIDPFPPPRRFRMHRRIYVPLKRKGEELERQLRQGRVYVPREHRNRLY